MANWLITRHPGAIEWFKQTGFAYDHHLTHLSLEKIEPNDKVYGSLPIHLAAEVCAKGAEYWHISLDLPAHLRGQELGKEQLALVNARLERFYVSKS